MTNSFKRALFFLHRWAGIILGPLIVLWFFSGLVTMYVGYPKLTPAERLARLRSLDVKGCCISLDDAWRRVAAAAARPRSATLTSIANRPAYKFEYHDGIAVVDGVTGRVVGHINRAQAVEAARLFLPGSKPLQSGFVQEDWWTVWSALESHRPLYWVDMDDRDQTRLYVSSVTGEVVLDATRSERRWNLVGPWLHWLLMFRSPVRAQDHWRTVIIVLSLAALLLALSGVTAGVMRWRFRGTYGSGQKSPYRKQFMRWHHVIGLFFGVVTITWIFSGLMSINPWDVFSDSESAREDRAISQAGVASSVNLTLDTRRILDGLRPTIQARELEWPTTFGESYLIARDGAGRTLIKTASGKVTSRLSVDTLTASASRLFPGVRIVSVAELRAYDNYFYARAMHTMRGHDDRRLPIVRIIFDDPHATWVYVSPYTGAVVEQLGSRQRVERWLFWFLHSWDSRHLLSARPLWDVVMITLCVGGLAIGVTGIVIGFRRLRSKLQTFRERATHAR